LRAKIVDLEAKLAESVPRQEADRLHVRLRQLETLLAESIPRREAKAEADSLRTNVAQLRDRLAGSVPEAELEAKADELDIARKTIEDLKEQLSRSSAKIEELQSRLTDSVPRSELEAIRSQLESNIMDLKAKLTVSIPRSEAEELRTTTLAASRSAQTSTQKARPKCFFCKHRNCSDAIYCTHCGHKLEDKKGTAESNSRPQLYERASSSEVAHEMSVMSTDQLTRAAHEAARGGLFLFIGNTSSTVILALGSIVFARLLGPSNYGLYMLTFFLPSVLVTLADAGMNNVLVRFSAKLRSEGAHERANLIVRLAFLLKISLSIAAFLICYIGAEAIAATILNRPELAPFLRLASATIIFQALFDAANNSFIGCDLMQFVAGSQIFQSILKSVLIPVLILLGFGLVGAVSGYVLSYVAAGLIGAAILFLIRRPFSSTDIHSKVETSSSAELHGMLRYGLPLYASALLSVVLAQYQSILLPRFATNVEMGNFYTAWNFNSLLMILGYPITTAMFPMFSKMDPARQRSELARAFRLAVKYTSLIVIPAAVGVMVFSRDLVDLTYGSTYTLAPQYVIIVSSLYLSTGIGYLVLGSFLNGVAETGTVLKMSLLTLGIYLPLGPALASLWGPYGILIAYLSSSALVAIVYGLRQAWLRFGAWPDLAASGRILLAAVVAALPSIALLLLHATRPGAVNFFTGGALYLLIYLTLAPVLGAVGKQDIDNLKTILCRTRILATVVKPLLGYEDWILFEIHRGSSMQ
jgi:O-antigen/teichoic acid export membrane protein